MRREARNFLRLCKGFFEIWQSTERERLERCDVYDWWSHFIPCVTQNETARDHRWIIWTYKTPKSFVTPATIKRTTLLVTQIWTESTAGMRIVSLTFKSLFESSECVDGGTKSSQRSKLICKLGLIQSRRSSSTLDGARQHRRASDNSQTARESKWRNIKTRRVKIKDHKSH